MEEEELNKLRCFSSLEFSCAPQRREWPTNAFPRGTLKGSEASNQNIYLTTLVKESRKFWNEF